MDVEHTKRLYTPNISNIFPKWFVKKVRRKSFTNQEFVHKTLKNGPPIRHFRRLQAFSKHINKIWFLGLAFVDKLASQNNRVKFLLIAIDVFSRFVRVQKNKNKTCQRPFASFQKNDSQKKTFLKNFGLIKKIECGGIFKIFCNQKDIKVCSTISVIRAAFAEKANQSLKHIFTAT